MAAWRVGLDLGAAREKVRVARALVTLPRLAQALARGELSYAKVRALTRVATPETEERLLAVGRAGTAEHVERIVRGWRRMDRKAERDEATRQHASRALYVYPAEDGTVTIRGRLAPEAGALLLKALTAARDALYQRERARRAAAQPADVSAETPTMAQQQADALQLWPRPRCTTASIPARRPSTTRWWSMWTPRSWDPDQPGQSVVEDGARVSAETSQRLGCDASRVVMQHDAEGRIFEVGAKTRTIPPALRRALPIGTAAVASPAAAAASARLTTSVTGPMADPPRSRTSCFSVAAITAPSTRRAIRSIASPMVSFASAGPTVGDTECATSAEGPA